MSVLRAVLQATVLGEEMAMMRNDVATVDHVQSENVGLVQRVLAMEKKLETSERRINTFMAQHKTMQSVLTDAYATIKIEKARLIDKDYEIKWLRFLAAGNPRTVAIDTLLYVAKEDNDQVKRLGAAPKTTIMGGRSKFHWVVLPGRDREPFFRWMHPHA